MPNAKLAEACLKIQIEEWKREAELAAHNYDAQTIAALAERIGRLAFAAGQSEPVANQTAEYSTPSTAGEGDDLRDLLRRCRRYVEADVQMMADISRHSPLDPASQATHDATEYESEKLLPLIDAALAAQPKSGSGAELVREVEETAQETAGGHHTYPARRALELVTHPWWPRLRAALLSGDAAREDAERYRWLRDRVPGSAYRIAGVIYSEGGPGVDAAIDRARGGESNA